MLSAYELACGYVEMYETPDGTERVKLYADDHHTCYWVHHYNAGYVGQGYVNNKQSYKSLISARSAFKQIATDIKNRHEVLANA